MIKKNLAVSILEDAPADVPDEIIRIHREALEVVWHTAHNHAQQALIKEKQRYKQVEIELIEQRLQAIKQKEEAEIRTVKSKEQLVVLERENSTLHSESDRRQGELKKTEDRVLQLEAIQVQQEHEIKKHFQEIGRVRANNDELNKKLHESNYQIGQDQKQVKQTAEDLLVNQRNRERLEKNITTATQESENVWKQLKLEQIKVAVAEALTRELRETIKKLNDDIKLLKHDKLELREDVESEKKVHSEIEKKLTTLSARAESQEWAYKEMISNLEKDLEIAREEASTVRTRMIKAEGKLERETKAIERLETKLVAAAGGNKH
ncbi:MAG: hypothetical protein VSS52_003760 [Thiotrichaceae bacterium]|nr:hypothetical protein [Thiotrichaceae bacterium]